MPFIVTPGYTFVDGEVFTATKANLAANPTVTGTGTMLFLNGDNTTGVGNLAQETYGYNNTQTYLHFVQTRHTAATGGTGNAWVLWLNNSVGATASTQPFTGNVRVIDASLQGVALLGTTTADSAASGYIGETTSATVLVGSATSLTTITTANVASLTLTAGDWDVSGAVVFNPLVSNPSYIWGGLSTASATIGTLGGLDNAIITNPTFGNATSVSLAPYRISTTATTTAYLVAQTQLTGTGTCSAFGSIRARRER